MSNGSKLSQDSAALSAANRRLGAHRKYNPVLKPLATQKADGNISKQSFSENNSVISDQDSDDVTLDAIEKLLTSTQSKMNELTKEFKTITAGIPAKPLEIVSTQLPKPGSGKGVRVTSNLENLLTATPMNPIPRNASKIGFSIKSGRQQRSLSKQKK